MAPTVQQEAPPTISVTFRGVKIEEPLVPGTTVETVKERLVSSSIDSNDLTCRHIKLMFKGKVLNDQDDLFDVLQLQQSRKKHYRLLASGVSPSQVKAMQDEFQNAPRIKDDLTKQGQADIKRRQRLGRQAMKKATRSSHTSIPQYGFGKIETLPQFPNREKAHAILESLAKDPGILACLAKHQWNVPCLAELAPDGKVGESAVCVMGLNQNKGQKILLRLRTDDLQGFRKILSIRKVLFHELSHNVHSEHDNNFFQLMRQIERECNEMDWTGGAGLSTGSSHGEDSDILYEGGAYRLGGTTTSRQEQHLSRRELSARAAMMRMTQEEQEIEDSCGCGKQNLFLPQAEQDDE